MSRSAFISVWLGCCLAVAVQAQTDTAGIAAPVGSPVKSPSDSADVLLVNVDLMVGSLEPIHIFMQKGQVYRVELTRDDVTLDFRTPVRSIVPPFFSALEGSSRPSSGITFEVYPRADAMYEMRIVGGPRGALTTIKLYRDISSSRARQKIISSPGWDIGLELAFGMHSAYPIVRSTFFEPAPVGEAGADLDFCFSASVSRFSGCAVGVGYQSRPGAESGVVWVFSEPRLRIVGPKSGRSGFEAGLLTRVGIGIVSGVNVNPVAVAPGLYVSREIRRQGASGGWSIIASYAHAWITETDNAQSNRFALGLGLIQ